MKIVFATNNQHKLEEIRGILGDAFEILSLSDINLHAEIPENAPTLEGNAIEKARYVYDYCKLTCFADDTGLEVEALGGAPGVHTARYADDCDHNDTANMDKLLENLKSFNNRKAQFRTVIALFLHNQSDQPILFEGIATGKIAHEKHGTAGFGYDPIFVPDGYDQSFAELGSEIKNKISHRAKATQQLADFLKKLAKP